MSRGDPWRVLGVAPTADEHIVKRAYAARLKAIDPEGDPEAFARLREALAAARHLAMQARSAEGDGSAKPADEPASASEPSPAPVPAPAWLDDIRAVSALVHGQASRESIFDEVGARMARLLADPAMEAVDHAAQVEQWAAETILAAAPRTNAMLLPAVERFGWQAQAEQWNCPPIVRGVVQRYADALLVAELEARTDLLGRGWRALTQEGKPKDRDAPAVMHLLAFARTNRPGLLLEIDDAALALWDSFITGWQQKPRQRAVARWRKGYARYTARRKALNEKSWFRRLWTFWTIAYHVGILILLPGIGIPLLIYRGIQANRRNYRY